MPPVVAVVPVVPVPAETIQQISPEEQLFVGAGEPVQVAEVPQLPVFVGSSALVQDAAETIFVEIKAVTVKRTNNKTKIFLFIGYLFLQYNKKTEERGGLFSFLRKKVNLEIPTPIET